MVYIHWRTATTQFFAKGFNPPPYGILSVELSFFLQKPSYLVVMLMQFEMFLGPPSTFSATHSFSAVSSTQAWPKQNYLRDVLQKNLIFRKCSNKWNVLNKHGKIGTKFPYLEKGVGCYSIKQTLGSLKKNRIRSLTSLQSAMRNELW